MPTMSALIISASGHLSALEAGASSPLKGTRNGAREGRGRDLEKEVRGEDQQTCWVVSFLRAAMGTKRHLIDVC